MLTARNKARTAQKAISVEEENRYINVKRSMCAVKHTLDERRKIKALIKKEEEEAIALEEVRAVRTAARAKRLGQL